MDLTYPYDYLGAGPETLAGVADGTAASPRRCKTAKRPLVIVGQGALARPDGAADAGRWRPRLALASARSKDGWNGFSVLHTAASRVGALDLGFVPGEGGLDAAGMAAAGALDVLFLLGADEIDVAPGAFVIYLGSHGDRGAHRADVILPGAAYTEKTGTYVNTEGRAQLATAPGSRRATPRRTGRSCARCRRARPRLPFDTLPQLRAEAVRGASAHGPDRRW